MRLSLSLSLGSHMRAVSVDSISVTADSTVLTCDSGTATADRTIAIPQSPSITLIAPGGDWNGTAGSASLPSDWTPTTTADRTAANAMPAIQPLLDRGGLCFDADDLVIGCQSFAGNNTGSISTTVEVWIEGQTYTLSQRKHSYTDVNGVGRSVWGYFAQLDFSAWPQDGSAYVYFRSTASDVTQSPRVIGPYTYTRRTTLNDYTIYVQPSAGSDTAGVRYRTLVSALNYLSGVSADNPVVILEETADYFVPTTITGYAGGDGYVTIQCADGVNATIKGTTTLGGASNANVNIYYNGMRFRGSGIKFDFAYINTIAPSASKVGSSPKDLILDGVDWYMSTGRNSKYALRKAANSPYNVNATTMKMVARDMTAHAMLDAFYALASIVLNCEVYDIAEDVCKGPENIYGLYIHDVDGSDIKAGYDAFTLTKTGSNFWRATKRLTSNVYYLDLESSSDGVSFSTDVTITLGWWQSPVSMTAAYGAINTFGSGWAATGLTDTYDADSLTTVTDPAQTPVMTGNTGVKADGATFTFKQRMDVHGDVIQAGGGTFTDNNIVVNVRGVLTPLWQQFFYKLGTWRDCFIVNHACSGATQGSVMGRAQTEVPMNNCHFWHMTLDQTFGLMTGTTSDSYCSIKANLLGHDTAAMSITSPGSNSVTIDFNHFVGGSAPASATNSTLGGSLSGLIDTTTFIPTGLLGTATSQVVFDVYGSDRGTTSRLGAVA